MAPRLRQRRGQLTAPLDDVSAAAWLAEELVGFEGRVSDVVPASHEAHVRLLHRPDQGLLGPGPGHDPEVAFVPDAASWAAVGAACGTRVHPEVQWRSLVGPGDPHRFGSPLEGSLDRLTLARLVDVLRAHTTTPDACLLALWHGFGWSPAAWRDAPTLRLPGREYWLFEAALDDVVETSADLRHLGMDLDGLAGGTMTRLGPGPAPTDEDARRFAAGLREAGVLQSPSLWWPHDRAWVVGSEIDVDTTVVAGSRALVDQLLADPDLETVEVGPDTSLRYDADTLDERLRVAGS